MQLCYSYRWIFNYPKHANSNSNNVSIYSCPFWSAEIDKITQRYSWSWRKIEATRYPSGMGIYNEFVGTPRLGRLARGRDRAALPLFRARARVLFVYAYIPRAGCACDATNAPLVVRCACRARLICITKRSPLQSGLHIFRRVSPPDNRRSDTSLR